MELLPTSNAHVESKDVWTKFLKQKEKIIECYGDYPDLCGLLHKYIKSADHALVLGANNSTVGESLYDVGYHSLVVVDSNENAIKKLVAKNENKRPEMKFASMDFGKMTYGDDSFNVVLDRGTVDSLILQDTSGDIQDKLSGLFEQIQRVLKLAGRFICVSFAQDEVVKPVLEYFSNEGWPVRIHKLPDKEQDESGDGKKEFQPPVYVFVCTKFKKMPQMTKKILEVCLHDNQPTKRYDTIDAIQGAIQETQQYAMVRYNIQNRNQTEDGISVVLCNSATNQPRYTLHVVNSASAKRAHQKFAIFIVPEGRETEWLFASDAGRSIVASQAGFQRVLITCLHRDNTYENLDAIKKELSQKVMELAPPGLDRKHKVPFLTIGDDLGYREVRYRGKSDFSGAFVVEDVRSGEGAMLRRLVFLSAKDAVQSEVRLLPEKPKKKGKQGSEMETTQVTQIDTSYLASGYQRFQVVGMATIPQFQSLLEKRLDMLIIGLGGGIIPMFIYTHFPKVYLDVVDIDPAIVDVAKNWFGCVEDERMTLHAEDGIKFIADKAKQDTGHRYHDVIFDIDSKDLSVGMSCPPKVFVEVEFLQMVKDKILHPQGVFQLNLVARDKELKEQVIQDIKSVFPTVLRRSIEDTVNEIIYALPQASPLSDAQLKESVKKAGVAMQKIAKSSSTPVDPETDLSKVLEGLVIQC
ncbi:eEF1A lysine and N-terminal methyltransferase-like [Amphiura filiformis]|uniref:eEF1A lysine and N-terminal methyltransferase-like n=1 Tax=Amphiura filiformis TaxID=82378 RepID=UPI003B21CB43